MPLLQDWKWPLRQILISSFAGVLWGNFTWQEIQALSQTVTTKPVLFQSRDLFLK